MTAGEDKPEVNEAQNDLHQGGRGGGETDVENARPFLAADPKAQGKSNAEGSHDSLEHNEHGTSGSIEKADEAE